MSEKNADTKYYDQIKDIVTSLKSIDIRLKPKILEIEKEAKILLKNQKIVFGFYGGKYALF